MRISWNNIRKWLIPTLIVFSGALFLITIISAYGGYFNPAEWTMPAIGVLFFPYFAMATMAVAVLWLISRHYVMGCIGIAALLACGPTFINAMPLRFWYNSPESDHTFKMITFNTLHLRDSRLPDSDFNRALHFLIHSDADFICMQELYGLGEPEIPEKFNAQIDSLIQVYPYYSVDWSREVEFVSKYPFEYIEIQLGLDTKYGSCAAYKMNIHGHPLTVVNVHLPSYLLSPEERNIITEAGTEKGFGDTLREFEESIFIKMKNAFIMRSGVSEAVAEFADSQEGNVIVCGDFNDVPGSWTYRNFTKKGFADAYAQTGFGHLITYNEHFMFFHIDQILYRGDLVPLYVKKDRLDSSDHYPLIAEFEFL